MKLQDKKHKKDYRIQKICLERNKFVWHLIMNLKNNYLKKKMLKEANKKCKNFNIYNVVFFFFKKNTWRYHYFTPMICVTD